MTLAMCAHVIFPATDSRGRVELRKVSSVEIKQSVHDICQSATLTLPRNISELQQQQLKTYIRRGDPVQVYLGYGGDLQLEFDGFVERTGADIPVVIEMRDAIWKLLQEPFNKSYSVVHVPTLVTDLVGSGFAVQALDATVGPMRFVKTTKAMAFKALRDEFGLMTYVKGGTVFVGELYDAQARTAVYDQERNVKSSDLKFKVADDVKLKVTAESTLRNGDKMKVEVGDPEGEQRTLSYYGISSEAELKKLAEADMAKFKYDGYEGGFKAWGLPVCQFGDKVQLQSLRYPERNGLYLAEGVTITFGPSGFERDIKLAQRWT
jgi:hypothetical protein